jgi:DNA/RNA endonuclease YhcR with UshA esterase domain
MSRKIGVFAVGLALSSLAVPLSAHHSWTAEYDAKKPVTVKGTVSKVEWTNPHTHFYVDVTDASGKVTTWNFEMASTPALERAGWSRKTLPIGTQVTVEGFAGRSVAERAIVTSFKGPDGKEFFVPKLGN